MNLFVCIVFYIFVTCQQRMWNVNKFGCASTSSKCNLETKYSKILWLQILKEIIDLGHYMHLFWDMTFHHKYYSFFCIW
jgi:hypothetical protein